MLPPLTFTADDIGIALLHYTLLGRTYRLFDSGGESGRSLKAQCVETVILTMPRTVKEHPLAPYLRQAIEADTTRFRLLAENILYLPRLGEPANEEAFIRKDVEEMAASSIEILNDWLTEIIEGKIVDFPKT